MKKIVSLLVVMVIALSSVTFGSLASDNFSITEQIAYDIMNIKNGYTIFDKNGDDITYVFHENNNSLVQQNKLSEVYNNLVKVASRAEKPTLRLHQPTLFSGLQTANFRSGGVVFLDELNHNLPMHNSVRYEVSYSYKYDPSTWQIVQATAPLFDVCSLTAEYDGYQYSYISRTANISSNKLSVNFSFTAEINVYLSEIVDDIYPVAFAFRYRFSDSYTEAL